MTQEPDSPQSNSTQSNLPPESPNGAGVPVATSINETTPPDLDELDAGDLVVSQPTSLNTWQANPVVLILGALGFMILGLSVDSWVLGLSGAVVALLLSLLILWPSLQSVLANLILPQQRRQVIAAVAIFIAFFGILKFLGVYQNFFTWSRTINWDGVGSIADWFGALGQIFIAVLAVYIAWQQYVISRDLTQEQNRLTSQQNILTQQQTIDAYFQGVSDLALDDEGLLEDWPQERAFSEGRTAAILSSVDAAGKAKVLRFLSQSRLLTPLRRDRHLGRPILNGEGGYEEDRQYGVRVIDLGIMLAGADLSGTDLRWTELSEANLVRANLSRCDLVKANLSRTILYEANLAGADLKATRFFYGNLETATPRSRSEFPNYKTGLHTGAVVENADFTGALRMDENQRYYCCAWGGSKTRETIPGGCEGIPNKLGR